MLCCLLHSLPIKKIDIFMKEFHFLKHLIYAYSELCSYYNDYKVL